MCNAILQKPRMNNDVIGNKILMNSFVEFLQHRFSPCVYIFASEEAKKAFPDYKSLIRCAFEAAIENNGIKFRIIFPDELYKEDILFE